MFVVGKKYKNTFSDRIIKCLFASNDGGCCIGETIDSGVTGHAVGKELAEVTTRVDTFTNKVIMERDGKLLAIYPLEHKLEADKIASVMNDRGIDVT